MIGVGTPGRAGQGMASTSPLIQAAHGSFDATNFHKPVGAKGPVPVSV